MQLLSSTPLRQRYQVLAEHARRLHNAAQTGDWETVTQAGDAYVAAGAALQQLPQASPLDEQDRQACLQQLSEIMSLEHEAGRLIHAQMQDIRERMGHTRQSRQLLKSYGRLQPHRPT